ncbi:substrate-binding periplasmic protein [Vibrio sp. SCSIO 43137]|uniref:substrate-binding periplasmic protein n=1 Tax=Vibrio sp. SCSIO 43137 TaxID=3021011 RepID=UPI00230754F0|nr:transporter substrate-binding domain-containing protein [Vibrio sp. SCSIO 43137]WCE31564.1 transporter substrate-binding domain-containing protein [Vibrio sp. SCSIO 43137]
MSGIKALSLLLLGLLLPATGQAKVFVATSDIWAPFFMEQKGHYSGIGVDILREVFKRTGDQLTIKALPMRRAEWLFEENSVDLIVMDSPSWNDPGKADTYLFSDTILSVREHIYFSRTEVIQVSQPEDMAQKVIGTRKGYRFPLFSEAFSSGLVTRHEADSDLLLLKLLIANRTDAIFMDSVAFAYATRTFNINRDLFVRGMELSHADLGIKLTAANSAALPRINKAIAEMKLDGTIARICNQYLSEEATK